MMTETAGAALTAPPAGSGPGPSGRSWPLASPPGGKARLAPPGRDGDADAGGGRPASIVRANSVRDRGRTAEYWRLCSSAPPSPRADSEDAGSRSSIRSPAPRPEPEGRDL